MAILSTAKIVGAVSCAIRTGRRVRNAAGDIMHEVVEEFQTGFSGKGWKIWERIPGKWKMEVDELAVRGNFTVFELLAYKVRALRGSLGITQACGKIKTAMLDESGENWLLTLEEQHTGFQAHDFIRAQSFSNGSMHGYWVEIAEVREAEGVQTLVVPLTEFSGSISTQMGFECVKDDYGEMNFPAEGDDIVQFGNSQNSARQSAIYLHADESGQPAIDILLGIRAKSFAGCLKLRMGGDIPGTDGLKGFYCENGMIKGVDEIGHTLYCIYPDGTAEFGNGSARFAANKSGFIAGGAISWEWRESTKKYHLVMSPDVVMGWENLSEEARERLVPEWVRTWESEKVQIGSDYMISPRFFSGTNAGTAENPLLTGIAIGKECVEIGGEKRSGIYALVENEPVFELDPLNKLYRFKGEIEADKGKLGVFSGEPGMVSMMDEEGERRLIYSNGKVESLEDILAKANFSGELGSRNGYEQARFYKGNPVGPNDYAYYAEGAIWLGAGTLNIPRNGASLSMEILMQDPFNGNFEENETDGVHLIVELLSGNQVVRYVHLNYGGDPWYGEDIRLDGLSKGEYTLKVHYRISAIRRWDRETGTMMYNYMDYPVSISAENIRWKVDTSNYRRIAYFSDGMYFSYPDNVVYQSEAEGFIAKGKSDLPGVLCAARISKVGACVYKWGKYVGESNTEPNPGVVYNNGLYTVSHSIGHKGYVPIVTPTNSNGAMVDMEEVYENSFTFKIINRGGTAIQSAFYFQCVGSNG